MSDDVPVPPPVRKRRFGCLAWGALIVALIVALTVIGFFILVGAGVAKVSWMRSISDDTQLYGNEAPANPMSWMTEGAATNQALSQFQTALQNNQSASLQFTAEQINHALSNAFAQHDVFFIALFTFTGNEGEVQVTTPTEPFTGGMVKGRYFNMDMTFEPRFDSAKKEITIIPHSVTFGTDERAGTLAPSHVPDLMKIINGDLNQALRSDPTGKLILDRATSIKIENSELIIQAQ